MKLKSTLAFISATTRSVDWRLSFVPFIMACVYLWSSLFNIGFSLGSLSVFALSVCTTFGFAALGYFINEFFDKADDLKAGKINKLSLISRRWQLALFIVILSACFLPWLYLPKNTITFYLILAELSCFILYSAPYLRMKRSTYFAGILDTLYAYLIPGLLSYHTYSLLASRLSSSVPILFFIALFFIGYRNIFLHQIKDILGDQKAGMISLPMRLGVKSSYVFLKLLYFLELVLILSFSVELIFIDKRYMPCLLLAIIYLGYVQADLLNIFKGATYFALLPIRHVLDLLYQLWFPLLQLSILVWIDWRWVIIVPFHLLFFVNRDFIVTFYGITIDYLWYRSLRPLLSAVLNYPIFLLFKMFGVDLIKEKKSALSYLKNKFR